MERAVVPSGLQVTCQAFMQILSALILRQHNQIGCTLASWRYNCEYLRPVWPDFVSMEEAAALDLLAAHTIVTNQINLLDPQSHLNKSHTLDIHNRI